METRSIAARREENSVTLTEDKKEEDKKLVLKLKEKKNKITWTEDTVDNENMGKKSSKRMI
jgi:hypothetical protein